MLPSPSSLLHEAASHGNIQIIHQHLRLSSNRPHNRFLFTQFLRHIAPQCHTLTKLRKQLTQYLKKKKGHKMDEDKAKNKVILGSQPVTLKYR